MNKWTRGAEEFHARHPEVMRLLAGYAVTAQRRGHKVGIELIWNRMRWDVTLRTGEQPYKLNQNYKAWYARKLMEDVPALAGYFETRRLRAAA